MFVARRAVCFDRWYEIGEVIPSSVLDPKQLRRILGNGRVAWVEETVDNEVQVHATVTGTKKKKKK